MIITKKNEQLPPNEERTIFVNFDKLRAVNPPIRQRIKILKNGFKKYIFKYRTALTVQFLRNFRKLTAKKTTTLGNLP